MRRHIIFLIPVVLLSLLCGCERRPRAQSDTLYDLARRGDVDQIKALLARGADVNAKDQWGATPLHAATIQGHEEVVKLLLTRGANINVQDNRRATPLHYALVTENELMIKLLIERHANLNVVDEEGQTPAATIMHEGYAGANQGPETAEARASHRRCAEIARILLAAGANATIHLAAYAGDLEKVKSIVATGTDVNTRDKDGRTALHWAAVAGRKDVVVFLMDHGANPNAGEKRWGHTPLHGAVRHGQTDVAEVLIAAGANLEAKTSDQETPLFIAASSGHMALTESLLTHGANVNADRAGDKALDSVAYFALLHRHGWRGIWPEFDFEKIAELLLSNGAEVNDDPRKAATLLTFAAECGLRNLAEKVLAKGNADINAWVDYSEYNPLLAAISSGQTDIAEMLIAARADVNIRDHLSGDTTLHIAARKSNEELVRLLLAKGINIDTQNVAGETPLHVAVVAGGMSMVEFLASQGACVNTADVKGNTPLHHAARESRDMTELLISKGAVVNATNDGGDTPLHNAALRGRKEIVELLLAHGADADARNRAGKTPQDLAIHRGHMDIIELLLKHTARE
jgi:ankyrin repeat protein